MFAKRETDDSEDSYLLSSQIKIMYSHTMFLVWYFSFALIVAFVFALLEVQIEGKNGWAAKLPTWRMYRSWFKFLGADKPLTGYHTYLWLLLLLLIHTPFLFIPWQVANECLVLSLYVLILRVEDFLWFVVNPLYGIQKFSKKYIPWHTHWCGPVPMTYITGFAVWLVLFFLGTTMY